MLKLSVIIIYPGLLENTTTGESSLQKSDTILTCKGCQSGINTLTCTGYIVVRDYIVVRVVKEKI